MTNHTQESEKVSPLYDPRVRSLVFQALLLLFVGWLIYEAVTNAVTNLQRQKIASGLGFWDTVSGFDINQTLIPYSATSTYGRAFWVGLLNTLLVASIGIALATLLGFVMGVARLSSNFIVSKLAMIYVEVIRNIPLLLQLMFWYNAVLKPLPNPRQSIVTPGGVVINNRGLMFPEPVYGPGAQYILYAFLIGLVATFGYRIWAHRRQAATGQQSPVGLATLALVIGLPLIAYFATGRPVSFNAPELKGFNYVGGVQIFPEFVALLLGLVIYTAAFIAEIVRAGILAVNKGQTEASYAVGLRPGPTLKLVVIPQALRVIIPPLTSQYLNLTKNSSLAVFIGYPDLVQIFTGTVLNQTGQAVEVVAITMLVYLTISLTTATLMNWYNARKALVER
jgi:general L-amino acid transport system permease protein